MKDCLDLTVHEQTLISNGLQVMMTKNIKTSVQSTEKLTERYYEDLNLWLFELSTKVRSPDMDKYVDLSFSELNMIKSSLTLLDDFTYQKSLEEKEQDKTQYYVNCKLEITQLREKINGIESFKMYGTK